VGKGEKRGGSVPGNRILSCLLSQLVKKYRDHGLEAISGTITAGITGNK